MKKNKFYLEDVVKGLKKIETESVDIIIIDPPYNIGNQFNGTLPIDKYVAWCNEWLVESVRILKPTGSMFIYGFSETLAHISVNLDLKQRWLIWHYKNKAVPSYKSGFQRSHESIIYAYKDNPIFNVDDIRIPYSKEFLKQVGKKRTKSDTARYGNSSETFYKAHDSGALPRDVFVGISALAGGAGRKERYFLLDGKFYLPQAIKLLSTEDKKRVTKHPTQKPFALTERLLLASKPKKNGFVVIPFGGSGSEAVICKKLEMDFIGFDIEPEYIFMSNEAVKNWKKLI